MSLLLSQHKKDVTRSVLLQRAVRCVKARIRCWNSTQAGPDGPSDLLVHVTLLDGVIVLLVRNDMAGMKMRRQIHGVRDRIDLIVVNYASPRRTRACSWQAHPMTSKVRSPQFGQGLISRTSIPISWKRHALWCAEPYASMRHFLRAEFSDNVQQIGPIALRAMQRSPTAARKVRSLLIAIAFGAARNALT